MAEVSDRLTPLGQAPAEHQQLNFPFLGILRVCFSQFTIEGIVQMEGDTVQAIFVCERKGSVEGQFAPRKIGHLAMLRA